MEKNDLEMTRMSHFVGIGLVLGFLLPHTSIFLFVNPLLCLFYQCFKQNRALYKYNWIVVVPIMLTLLINLPQDVTIKSIMACFTILLYFFCFPMVTEVKIPNGYFYFILSFIVLTQLAYVLNISVLMNIMNTYYPISEEDKALLHMQSTITYENMMNFRMGGLYHNPNHCSRSLTMLLACFLVLNSEKPVRKILPFIIISFFGILLTGSRTGFFVGSTIILLFLSVDNKVSALWRYSLFAIFLIVLVLMLISGSETFRGFNVIQGFSNSANVKFDVLKYYLSTEDSVFRLLIGYLDNKKLIVAGDLMAYFDADYGNIIFCYGFVGFFAIILYFFTVFIRLDKTGRIFLILLLWMISSAILSSYRAVFLFMLLLSLVYSSCKKRSFLSK